MITEHTKSKLQFAVNVGVTVRVGVNDCVGVGVGVINPPLLTL